jgi:predicted aspartyl protease
MERTELLVSLKQAFFLFLAGLVLCMATSVRLLAVGCEVTHHTAPGDADKAYLAADYDKAAGLYQTTLSANPGDLGAISGLVHTLLRQQKAAQAAEIIKSALGSNPNSAVLLTLRGEIDYRLGVPWNAADAANSAVKSDPCNARARLLFSRVAEISSLHATSRAAVLLAHRLDPQDPEIRQRWIGTLPPRERIAEIEAYLEQPTGDDAQDILRLRMYLDQLKKMVEEPRKACHLVSATTTADVPFIQLMRDATHVRAYGLEVKLNEHAARLEIDTGAGGLLISRAVADRAGLKALSKAELGGIGDKGSKSGYTAYVDSIRIGSLEFQDCVVRVLDSKNVIDDIDGLIGMDVLGQFLVTLDFPMRELKLGPLPPRPGDTSSSTPALKTNGGDSSDEDDDARKNVAGSAGSAQAAAGGTANGAVHPAHGPYDRYVAPEMKDYTAVYRIGHDLIMPAELNNKVQKLFIIDTGAWATSIDPSAAREITKVHSEDTRVKGISGEVNKVYTTGDITFRFANLSQKAYGVIAFDTSNISKNTGMEISGFIGANTLKLLTIHIDYRDGLVKFDYDPNRGYKN